MKKNIQLFISILFLTILFSCSTDPEPIKGPEQNRKETIVADITKVIDQEIRNKITAIDTSNFTFTLSGETDAIKNLKVGDILVDSASVMAPNGYLRKIVAIEGTGGQKILRTEQGKLSEAVPQASIRFKSGVLNKSMLKSVEFSDGVKFSEVENLNKTDKTEFNVFALDFDKVIGDVTLSGYSSLDMEFIFEFDWSFALKLSLVEIDLFKTAIAIDQTSNIKVESSNGSTLDERISIARLNFTPWTFSIGPVPVVLVPQVELFMEIDGTVSAELNTWASESYSGEIGLKYSDDNGWDGIGESEAELDFNPPSLKASTNFEAHVGPEVKVLLYGVAGPTISITGCCELDAKQNSSNNWALDYNIGARAKAGVEVFLLGFDLSYDTEIFCIKEKLFTLNNEPFGNSISITNPINNASLLIGNPVTIETEVIGTTPSEVQFYINGSLVSTDTEAPYQYIWETKNSSDGNHTISVKEIISGSEVSSDKVIIALNRASWTALDLSQFGVGKDAVLYQITFIDGNHGWIFGKENGFAFGSGDGFTLITEDGGNTWKKYNRDRLFREAVVLNTKHLYVRWGNFVHESSNGGESFSSKEIEYCPQPGSDCQPATTFPYWVEGIAINNKGELVAVGESGNSSGTQDIFNIRKARTSDNNPTGTYTSGDYYSNPGDFAKIYFKNNFGITYNIGTKSDDMPVYLTTTDDGVTWTEHPATFQEDIGGGTYANDTFFWDENTGWIVGGMGLIEDGYIAKTTDGGKSFNKIKFWDIDIKISGGVSAGAVFFISKDEGYVGFRNYISEGYTLIADNKIYHTLDGGATWKPVEEIVSKDGINDIFFLSPKVGWAVGTRNIIYKYTSN